MLYTVFPNYALPLLVVSLIPTYMTHNLFLFFYFFFQAEDGIRDLTVTGVQTCALPISGGHRHPEGPHRHRQGWEASVPAGHLAHGPGSGSGGPQRDQVRDVPQAVR